MYMRLHHNDVMSTVDHSRVELQLRDGIECSDYINANFISVSYLLSSSCTCKELHVTDAGLKHSTRCQIHLYLCIFFKYNV